MLEDRLLHDLGPLIRVAREYRTTLLKRGALRSGEDGQESLDRLEAAERDYLEVANRVESIMALAYLPDETTTTYSIETGCARCGSPTLVDDRCWGCKRIVVEGLTR